MKSAWFWVELIVGIWLVINAIGFYESGHDLHGVFDTVLAAFMFYYASRE